MLVLPIINRNRILNVHVSLKGVSKVKTMVHFENMTASDIIVNGKSFNTSTFSESRDRKAIIEFIRNNSILYHRPFYVTTKAREDCKYDLYEFPLLQCGRNKAIDLLYVSTILDMQKRKADEVKGKYVSLKELGFDDIFTDDKISVIKRIVSSNPNTLEWEQLFRDNHVDDLISTLEFIRKFDCTVVKEASIPEDVFQQVASSFELLHSRDTKSLNKYYNLAVENRDVIAKMSYVNKLVFDKPFDLIQSESQRRAKQFVKADNAWENRNSA